MEVYTLHCQSCNNSVFQNIYYEYDLQNTIDYIYHNPAKLLDNNYKHLDFLNGLYKLSRDQINYVKNYNEAISGIYTGKFYGARLTQVYPKSVAFSQNAATVDVPLTMTVKLMFREMTTVLEDPSILAAYQDQVDSLFIPVDLNNNAWKINKAANFAINTAAMFQA